MIELFDATGKLIIRKEANGNNIELNITYCKPGVYYIKFTNVPYLPPIAIVKI